MEMLHGVWKQHLRPRALVGYGVKIFLPSPPNYVTRSPGSDSITGTQNPLASNSDASTQVSIREPSVSMEIVFKRPTFCTSKFRRICLLEWIGKSVLMALGGATLRLHAGGTYASCGTRRPSEAW